MVANLYVEAIPYELLKKKVQIIKYDFFLNAVDTISLFLMESDTWMIDRYIVMNKGVNV